jgi:hypothetical protein
LPTLRPTQVAEPALLASAILAERTLCVSELARADPTPAGRRVAAPKHHLLHRRKRPWRFLDNDRVDPLAVRCAIISSAVAHLHCGGRLALAIDWTMGDAEPPARRRVRSQVRRHAVPCHGRAAPPLQLADARGRLPADSGQNRREEAAFWAVVAALPPGDAGRRAGRP